MRHTMGQDWGGRRKLNPDDAPRVSGKQVREKAAALGIEVKNKGLYGRGGMWFWKRPDGQWYTLEQTNYLAMEQLRRIEKAEQ